MFHEPLTAREKLILKYLRKKNYGFNELYYKLSGRISRQTLKGDLDRLVKMQLVHRRKGRRGQKDVYQCMKTLTDFEERLKRLEEGWLELFSQLDKLSELVKARSLEPEKAGSTVAYLIYKAVHMESLGFAVDKTLSMEVNRRLLVFSIDKYYSFVDKVMMFGKQHPEILSGFAKACKLFLETARHTYKEIGDWMKSEAER